MEKRIMLAVFLMGFISLFCQTVLIWEFFVVFNGNELTIGIILANWILLSALGSLIVSLFLRNTGLSRPAYAALQVASALYLPIAVFLIRMTKTFIGVSAGEGLGIAAVIATSFLITCPLAFCIGAQFPLGCEIAKATRRGNADPAGIVYTVEALGFVVAGPVVTYLLISRLDTFSSVFLAGLCNTLSAIFVLKKIPRAPVRLVRIFALLSFLLFLGGLVGPVRSIQRLSLDLQWKDQDLVRYQNSLYGNLAVTKNRSQYTFYSNGLPIITSPSPDTSHIEDMVHFSMASHPDPKNVFVIGGGTGGLIREILKYPVEGIVYAELDPSLIALVNTCATDITRSELSEPRVQVRYADGRVALQQLKKERAPVDIIIVNLPPPSTLQLNRFYTKEFFSEARALLRPGGTLCLALPGSLSYLSNELRGLNATILDTASDVFTVTVIPGQTNLFLLSDRAIALSPDTIIGHLTQNQISTTIFNKTYLEERLRHSWLTWFIDSIKTFPATRKNLDLLPIGAFFAISYWNSVFSPQTQGLFRLIGSIEFSGFLVATACLLFLACASSFFVRNRERYAAGFAMATTGFAGMGLNLIVIYAYEAAYGYIFHHVALLFSSFMAGLAFGGYLATRRRPSRGEATRALITLEMSGVILALVVSALFPMRLVPFVFFIVSAAAGLLVGTQFPYVNAVYSNNSPKGNTGGVVYALDLLGSWVAALLVSALFLPLIGVVKTCILVALIKLSSLLTAFLAARNPTSP